MTLLHTESATHGRAAILVLSMVWFLTASCGEPFTIAGGGGGGAGGAGVTTGTTGMKKGDKCDATGDTPCDPGLYCSTKDCKTGTCEPLPAPQGQDWSPVCGCDGIFYWNADLAIASNVAFQLGGDCSQSKLTTCSPTDNPCSHENNVYCNLRADTALGCASATGYCTKLPESCDGTSLGGHECSVGADSCLRACDLMRDEKTWFKPSAGCTPP